jgi:aldose 1-epimerase
MITIAAGSTTLVVVPELGASIQAFQVDGEDVLRRGRPDLENPLEMSAFALVPWTNRIADGTFVREGDTVSVGGTPLLDEPHGAHGHGWLRRWDVVDETEGSLALEFLHPSGAWPWRYRATQTMTLEPGRLSIELTVTNLSDRFMPASFGFHPYFERPGRLTATVDGVWTGEGPIPDHWEERPEFRSLDVDALETDATYTGWDGRALLTIQAGRFELASDLPMLHLFTPRGRSFFCVEPTAAAPDALNHPERGGFEIHPGTTVSTWMRLSKLEH